MTADELRAAIAAALSPRASVRPLQVDGLSLYVRSMTGAERVQLQRWQAEAATGGDPLTDSRVAALGLCDEHGERLYSDPAALAALEGAALARISRAVLRASGLVDDAVDDAEKN